MAYECVDAEERVISYNTFSVFRPFSTFEYDAAVLFKTLSLVATDSTEPGATIYTDYIKVKKIIWWRGISGTPGGFSNYRKVEDENGIRFAATWDGLKSKPTSSITIHGVIECLISRFEVSDPT